MLWGMLVLGVKLLAITYAAVDSVRSRYWVGIGALAVTLYLVAALASAVLPSPMTLPPGALLREYWWALLMVMPVLSAIPMWGAWRLKRDMPSDEPRAIALERAAFGFLANLLLDTAALVLLGAGALLMSSSDV